MSFFNRSKTKILKQVEIDIWDYCALNPFKYNNFLKKTFTLKFSKISLSRRELENSNLLVKADKKLKKIFLKKKSYFSKILLLKRRLRLFFNFFTTKLIEKFFVSIFFKRNFFLENFMESLAIGLETFLFFLLLRIRYFFSFFEADFFIKQGLVAVEGHVVFDSFFYISIGDSITLLGTEIKVFCYKRHYIYWFNEFIRNGNFYNRIFFRYSLKNFYVRARLKEYSRYKFLKNISFLGLSLIVKNLFYLSPSFVTFLSTPVFFKDYRIFQNSLGSSASLTNYLLEHNNSFPSYCSFFHGFPDISLTKVSAFLYFFKFYYSFLSLKKIFGWLFLRLERVLKVKLFFVEAPNVFYLQYCLNKMFFLCYNNFIFGKVIYLYTLLRKKYIFDNFNFILVFRRGEELSVENNSYFYFFIFLFFQFYFFLVKKLPILNNSNHGLYLKLFFKKCRSFKRFFIDIRNIYAIRLLNKYLLSLRNYFYLLFNYFLFIDETIYIPTVNGMELLFNLLIKRTSRSFSLWTLDLVEKANTLSEFVIKELKKKKSLRFLKSRNYSAFLWREERDLKNFKKTAFLYRLKLSNVKTYSVSSTTDNNKSRFSPVNAKQMFTSKKELNKRYLILKSIVKNLRPRLRSNKT